MKRLSMMMVAVALCLTAINMSALAQQWDWAQKIQPASTTDMVEVLAVDEAGGHYYLTGRFTGTLEYVDYFGQTCSMTSSGTEFDFFVARASSSGVLDWVTVGGNPTGDDQGNDITFVFPNRIIVTGYVSNDAGTVTIQNRIPSSGSCQPPISTNVSVTGTGGREAFIASLNPTTGGVYWVSSLRPDDPMMNPDASLLSEGRGIVADPSGGGRFFVTGLFQGDIRFRQITHGGTSTLINPPSPVCAGITDYQARAVPAASANTYVMQYHIDGNLVWFHQLEGDASNPSHWNTGQDIAAYAGGQLYLTGNYTGDLNQRTSPGGPTPTLLSTSDAQAGYLLNLSYSNGSYGFIKGTSGCPTGPLTDDYPANGFVRYTGLTPHAQSIETRDPGGIVVMKSIAAKDPVFGSADPVVVGEWMHSSSGTIADVFPEKSPSTTSFSSLSTSGDRADAFVARYSNDVLSNAWFNTVGGPNDVNIGGRTGGFWGWYGSDGAAGAAYGSSQNLYTTGRFTGSADASSVFAGTKSIASSSGSADDIGAWVAGYSFGDNLFFEGLKGACDFNQEEVGSAVTALTSGYTGAYFAGYSYGDIGVNQWQPGFEQELTATVNTVISYYGSHAPDECFSPAIPAAAALPTAFNTFYAQRSSGTTATVFHWLPAGTYYVGYREIGSEPMACADANPLTWQIASVTSTGVPGNITAPGLIPGQFYDFYMVGLCGSGRPGVIDPLLFMSAKTQGIVDAAPAAVEMEVFPNPVTDRLTVSIPAEMEEEITLELIASDGRQVMREALNSGGALHVLNVADIASGLYVLRCTNAQGEVLHTQQLVRQGE